MNQKKLIKNIILAKLDVWNFGLPVVEFERTADELADAIEKLIVAAEKNRPPNGDLSNYENDQGEEIKLQDKK